MKHSLSVQCRLPALLWSTYRLQNHFGSMWVICQPMSDVLFFLEIAWKWLPVHVNGCLEMVVCKLHCVTWPLGSQPTVPNKGVFFSLIIFSQLRWPIELKYSQTCYFMLMLGYTKWEDWFLTITKRVPSFKNHLGVLGQEGRIMPFPKCTQLQLVVPSHKRTRPCLLLYVQLVCHLEFQHE